MNSIHEIRRSPTATSSARSIRDVNNLGRRLRDHDQRRKGLLSSRTNRTPSERIDYHPELRCVLNTVDLGSDESDQHAGFEYLEDCFRAEAFYLEDALERVLILNLDVVQQSFKKTDEQFDDAGYDSVAVDSLEVTKRREARNNKSQMKVLKDFRRTISNPAMDTLDHQRSGSTIMSPSP